MKEAKGINGIGGKSSKLCSYALVYELRSSRGDFKIVWSISTTFCSNLGL